MRGGGGGGRVFSNGEEFAFSVRMFGSGECEACDLGRRGEGGVGGRGGGEGDEALSAFLDVVDDEGVACREDDVSVIEIVEVLVDVTFEAEDVAKRERRRGGGSGGCHGEIRSG